MAKPFSIRLDEKTMRELERLAQVSGRTRPSVIRRLILSAASDPRSLAALGNMGSLAANDKKALAEGQR